MFPFLAGEDYTAVSQAFKFAPGQSTASVRIPITDDDIALESNITFTVALISSGDVVVLSNATVTIVDNDHGELTMPTPSYMYLLVSKYRILQIIQGGNSLWFSRIDR